MNKLNKLKARGASSSLASREKKSDRSPITTVTKKPTTTYNVPPMTLRLSLIDKQNISDWVSELQLETSRNVSPAKLYRALVALKDEIDSEHILELINKMQ